MDELVAFTEEHVSALTGLTAGQLRRWARAGMHVPAYGNGGPHQAYGRVYSFRDVVGLRTLARLREWGVPLAELRRVSAWLAEQHEIPWCRLRFHVAAGHVYFDDPASGARRTTDPLPPTAFPVALEPIANETRAAAQRLRERQPADVGQITRRRHVLHNAPAIAGTRIPTTAIWSFHTAGYDTAAIIREYPRLTPADVAAAIAHESRPCQRRAG